MAGLAIHLLGSLSIQTDQGRGELPQSQKAKELLCYLLLHRDRPVPRSTLAELLWPDCELTQGLKLLRQALWQLQSACRHGDAEQDRLRIDVTPRSLMLLVDHHCWLDIAEFEEAFNQVRGPLARPLTAEIATAADRAIGLYRGHLLEGFDFDWCIVEREWLRSAYLTMLDRLMVHAELQGEYELGIDYGERILRIDRAREYTHRRMMILHARLGNRTGALRQYDRCASALEAELDVLPARSTQLLRERVRAGGDLMIPAPNSGPDAAAPVHDGSAAAVARLSSIQRVIGELQSLIQSEFFGVEADAPSR